MAVALGASLLELVAAAGGAVGAGATWAWSRTPLSRARRQARAALAPLRRESEKLRKTLAAWREPAEAAARDHARAARTARLAQVPLAALKQAGARHVRWAALEQAGYRTLADVLGRPARELARAPGVGLASATRVTRAARALAERVADEPPALPDPELAGEAALSLAGAALDLLEARDVAGDGAGRLMAATDGLTRRQRAVRAEASFRRWLVAPFRRQRRRAALEEARAIAEQAHDLQERGLLREAQEGRARLTRARRPEPRGAEAIRNHFRARYTDCCTLLAALFAELGLGRGAPSTAGQGGLTADVVARVQAQELDTSGVRVALRRYQDFGARYVLAQERTILGDEMGLGKTLQALAAMAHLSVREQARHFFVVAPASLLVNWTREIERHTVLRAHRLHGESLAAALPAWVAEGGVAVTSYATLRSLDPGAALQQSDGVVDLLVADEAHLVKNPEAARTQATARLAERARRVCFLSGTPMENRPEELVRLVGLVRPAEGARLASAGLHLDAAARSVQRFHQAVAPVYLRRNQEDVLGELPEKIEVQEWVELGGADRAAYADAVRAGNFMAMRQQATLGAGPAAAPKLEHLADLLEDHRQSGRKVIVFSWFLKVLAAVARRFDALGVITGKVPVDERQALVDAFTDAEGHALLALQVQAGGQGLNIQAASAVVLMEPQLKPSTEAQAIARAHRMGQTRRVLVHRLLARDTCDETMLLLLADKQRLFDAYARQSAVKEAAPAATSAGLAKAVVAAEQDRLGGRPVPGEETPPSAPAPPAA